MLYTLHENVLEERHCPVRSELESHNLSQAWDVDDAQHSHHLNGVGRLHGVLDLRIWMPEKQLTLYVIHHEKIP